MMVFRSATGCPKCHMHSFMSSIEIHGVCPFCLVKLVRGWVDEDTNRFLTQHELDVLNGETALDFLKERNAMVQMERIDSLNGRTMTLRITRGEVIDLLLAVDVVTEELEADFQRHEKWDLLHAKLERQLQEFDEKRRLQEFDEKHS